jgi:hypothetical protein
MFYNTDDDAVSQRLAASYGRAADLHVRLNDTSRALDTAKRVLNDQSYWASFSQRRPQSEVDAHLRSYRALEHSVRLSFAALSKSFDVIVAEVKDSVAAAATEWQHTSGDNFRVPVIASNAMVALRLARDLLPNQIDDIKHKIGSSQSREGYARSGFCELYAAYKADGFTNLEIPVHSDMLWIDFAGDAFAEAKEALRACVAARCFFDTANQRFTEYARTLGESTYGMRLDKARANPTRRAEIEAEQHEKRVCFHSLHVGRDIAFRELVSKVDGVNKAVLELRAIAEVDTTDQAASVKAMNDALVLIQEVRRCKLLFTAHEVERRENRELHSMIAEYVRSAFVECAEADATA